jgi:hypothetical protein
MCKRTPKCMLFCGAPECECPKVEAMAQSEAEQQILLVRSVVEATGYDASRSEFHRGWCAACQMIAGAINLNAPSEQRRDKLARKIAMAMTQMDHKAVERLAISAHQTLERAACGLTLIPMHGMRAVWTFFLDAADAILADENES